MTLEQAQAAKSKVVMTTKSTHLLDPNLSSALTLPHPLPINMPSHTCQFVPQSEQLNAIYSPPFSKVPVL